MRLSQAAPQAEREHRHDPLSSKTSKAGGRQRVLTEALFYKRSLKCVCKTTGSLDLLVSGNCVKKILAEVHVYRLSVRRNVLQSGELNLHLNLKIDTHSVESHKLYS